MLLNTNCLFVCSAETFVRSLCLVGEDCCVVCTDLGDIWLWKPARATRPEAWSLFSEEAKFRGFSVMSSRLVKIPDGHRTMVAVGGLQWLSVYSCHSDHGLSVMLETPLRSRALSVVWLCSRQLLVYLANRSIAVFNLREPGSFSEYFLDENKTGSHFNYATCAVITHGDHASNLGLNGSIQKCRDSTYNCETRCQMKNTTFVVGDTGGGLTVFRGQGSVAVATVRGAHKGGVECIKLKKSPDSMQAIDEEVSIERSSVVVSVGRDGFVRAWLVTPSSISCALVTRHPEDAWLNRIFLQHGLITSFKDTFLKVKTLISL